MTLTTALVIEVPDSGAAIDRWRVELDPLARNGVPAHVTLLFPFKPVEECDGAVRDRIASVAAGVDPFSYRFGRTGWFGQHVVWLGPDEPAPFIRLTEALSAEFPENPPYDGAFADIVPHLTIGNIDDPVRLAEAEAEVAALPALTGQATRLSLLVCNENSWWRLDTMPLGTGSGRGWRAA